MQTRCPLVLLLHPASVSQPTQILKQYLIEMQNTHAVWCLDRIFAQIEADKVERGLDGIDGFFSGYYMDYSTSNVEDYDEFYEIIEWCRGRRPRHLR